MQDILLRAGCFIAIIVLGYSLKKIGFFKKEDFNVISKIVIKITLPASVVFSFSGKEIDPSMLILTLFGFGCGAIYVIVGFLINLHKSKEQQAFGMVNLSGYNIGNFTMPFVQSFLGPSGVITTSLFDTGNAFVCLGGAYSIASVVKDGNKLSLKKIIKTLVKSVPFDCYVIMTILCLAHISLPGPVIEFAEIVAGANAFMAMFMIGVGFEINSNKEQIGSIIRIISLRYVIAIIFAVSFYCLTPFSQEIRKTLVILCFGPIAAAVPAFTSELKGDVGLSSAINSISIIISILLIITILLLL